MPLSTVGKIIISAGNGNEGISISSEIRVRKRDTIHIGRYLYVRKRKQAASSRVCIVERDHEHSQCIPKGL